jgi:hypothetical protein
MSEVIDKPAAPVNSAKRAVSVQPGQQFAQREQKRQDWVVEATEGTTARGRAGPAVLGARGRADAAVRPRRGAAGNRRVDAELICTVRRAQLGADAGAEALRPGPADRKRWPPPQATASTGRAGRKFAVIRIADSQVVQDGFANRNDANAWLPTTSA